MTAKKKAPYVNTLLAKRLREDRVARRISWKAYWRLINTVAHVPIGEMTLYRTAMGFQVPLVITQGRIEDALDRLPKPDTSPRPRKRAKAAAADAVAP